MAKDASKPAKSGMVPMAAAFAAVSVLAVGTGWFLGSEIRRITETRLSELAAESAGATAETQAAARPKPAASTAPRDKSGGHGEAAAAAGEHGSAPSLSSGMSSLRLDPIVANIGTSEEEWVRMEVAVIYGGHGAAGSEEEKYALNEAIIGMLRSKSMDDLAGPSGFLHFREDLADTVAITTGGRATSAKILSLVVE